MSEALDDILDDLFHGSALAAFLDQAHAEQGWPSSAATRKRAYRYYEDALAEKNRRCHIGHDGGEGTDAEALVWAEE